MRMTQKLMKELRSDLAGRFEDALDITHSLDKLPFYQKREIAEACVESVITQLEFIAQQSRRTAGR